MVDFSFIGVSFLYHFVCGQEDIIPAYLTVGVISSSRYIRYTMAKLRMQDGNSQGANSGNQDAKTVWLRFVLFLCRYFIAMEYIKGGFAFAGIRYHVQRTGGLRKYISGSLKAVLRFSGRLRCGCLAGF